MIDPTVVTLTASGVALLVGLSGVGASLYSSYRSRAASLEMQYSGERAKALLRVMQLVELSGRAAQDRVFNLTQAAWEGTDPMTGEEGDPYGPERRPFVPRDYEREADVMALIGTYGDETMDAAVVEWMSSLDHIELAVKDAEFAARENGHAVGSAHFRPAAAQEFDARTALRALVRSTVRVAPRPRRAIRQGR